MKPTSFICRAFTAALLVGTLASCGDDDSTDATDAAAPSDDAAAATDCENPPVEKLDAGSSIATPDAASANLYAAQALGYFDEENLDVTIHAVNGSLESAKMVSTGQLDFGAAGTLEPVLQLNAQGESLVAIMQYSYKPIYSLAVPEGSSITHPSELGGAKVAVVSAASAAVPVLKYLAADYGVDPDSLDIVPIGLGAQAVTAIEQGRVDALMYWDTAYVDLEAAGLKLDYFSTEELDEGYASQGVFMRDGTFDDAPCDVPGRFARAMAKGTLFTQTNPEAALLAMSEVEPIVLENRDRSIAKTTRRAELYTQPPEADGQIGWSSLSNWERLEDVLLTGEVIDEPVDLDAVWDDQYLEAANDFDHDAIRKQAREYQG